MTFTVLELAGLHCQTGSSDKVWGAVLLEDETGGCTFTAVYGPRGGSMQGKPERMEKAVAVRHYAAKLKEKLGKGYSPIEVREHRFGLWPALTFHHPMLNGSGTTSSAPAATAGATTIASNKPRLVVSHVTSMDDSMRERLLSSEKWGMTEKVNGDRRTVEVLPGGELVSYNRRGLRKPAPEGAQVLATIGVPLMVDGESLPGGRYGIFDLLEANGTSVRNQGYAMRMQLLGTLVASLDVPVGPLDTGEDLFVLAATTDRELKRMHYMTLQANGGEGVVFRQMDGPDVEGNSRFVYKDKFLAELDAFVFGNTPGRDAGSLRMGLIRPSDGAVIEIAHCSGGLGAGQASEIRRLTALARDGQRPVLTVAFLLARTPGISLVEPRFTTGVRTDKLASECTTDQLVEVLGKDRKPLIAAALAVKA